jgi:hypothetical protein
MERIGILTAGPARGDLVPAMARVFSRCEDTVS